MTIIRSWSGDGLSPGAIAAGTGDTAFSGTQGSPTVAAGGDRSPRIAIPDAAGSHNVRWWPLPGNPLTNLAVRAYITRTGTPTDHHLIRGNSGGAERWSIRARASGRIGIYSNAAWQWESATGTLPEDGSLIRVEGVASGTSLTVTVYAGHTMTALATGTGTIVSGIDETWFGKAQSTQQSSSFTLDDLAVSDTAALIGPAEVAADPHTSSLLTSTGWAPTRRVLL